jgi:hypothetical protein
LRLACGTVCALPLTEAGREQLGANGVLGREAVIEEDLDLKAGG